MAYSFIKINNFDMQGPKKGQPLYLGLFACDPKQAAKTVQEQCKSALLDILKHIKPESYLEEGEELKKTEQDHNLQKQLNQEEITIIEKDYAAFDQFSAPKDNYHITSLFMGKNKEKLKKDEKQILSNWKNGVKQLIKIDFIVYVPNHLMAGSVADCGKIEVANKCPHMTLLLKQKAKAVESNEVLEKILDKAPELFKKKEKHIIVLNVPHAKSQHIILINRSFDLEGVAGDNISCGKK